MFDSFKCATTSTLGVSGTGGGSKDKVFLKVQTGTQLGMEIINSMCDAEIWCR